MVLGSLSLGVSNPDTKPSITKKSPSILSITPLAKTVVPSVS